MTYALLKGVSPYSDKIVRYKTAQVDVPENVTRLNAGERSYDLVGRIDLTDGHFTRERPEQIIEAPVDFSAPGHRVRLSRSINLATVVKCTDVRVALLDDGRMYLYSQCAADVKNGLDSYYANLVPKAKLVFSVLKRHP